MTGVLNIHSVPGLRLGLIGGDALDGRAQHEAGDYVRWFVEHAFVLVPAQSVVAQHIESFKQFPPRQQPGSFSVEQAMEKLRNPPSSN